MNSAVYFGDCKTDEDYRNMAVDLGNIAQENDLHICLLHGMRGHPRNVAEVRPNVFGFVKAADPALIYNADGLLNVCDNVITLVKNNPKFFARTLGRQQLDDVRPDHSVKVCKQKSGEEFAIPLWFDSASLSFCIDSERIPPAI